MGEDWLIDYIE